jgi:periplasmic copper chaperone A
MPRPRIRRTAAGAAALVGGLALALVAVTPASAHVRVDGDVEQGGYGVLTFRVPTESDTASTTGLTITFPSDTPIVSVSTQPKPGWTATVERAELDEPVESHGAEITDYVARVTWTADAGTGIRPGEFDTFAVSAGPMPEVDELALPATQSYDDGSVVDWDQLPADGAEPERPAPAIALAAAAGGASGADADADPAADTEGTTADVAAPTASTADTGTALGLGIAGLAAGVLALIVAVAALVRRPGARA